MGRGEEAHAALTGPEEEGPAGFAEVEGNVRKKGPRRTRPFLSPTKKRPLGEQVRFRSQEKVREEDRRL